MNNFLDPMCVPARISINTLDLVQNQIVAGLMGMVRNGGGLGTGDSWYLILSCIDLPVSSM